MECKGGRAGAPQTLARVRRFAHRVHDLDLSVVPLVPEAKGQIGYRPSRKEAFCEVMEPGVLGFQALVHLWMGRVKPAF